MVDEKDLRRKFKDYLNDKVSNGKLSEIDANTQYSDADYPRKHAQELGLDYFEMFKTDKDFEQALDLIKLNFEKNGKKNTTFLAYKRALLSFRDFYLEYLKNHTKKSSVKAWFIRSNNGEYVQDFLEKQVVAIGWLRESYEGKSRIKIKACIMKEFPNEKQKTIDQWAGCCWRFASEIKINDYVITNNNDGTIHIGKIIGEYEYSPDLYKENPHIRSVKWIEKIKRNTLPTNIQSYLKSSLTVTGFEDSEAIKCLEEICKQNSNKELDMTKIPRNQILYGPPGTGKTYNTIVKAMEIINGEKYDFVDNEQYEALKQQFDKLKQQGQIEFVTFHQSYSYEEFVEGIKPDLKNENDLTYQKVDGIFKSICKNASKTITDNFDDVYEKFINDLADYNEDNLFKLKTGKGKTFGITVNSNKNLSIYMGKNLTKWGTLTKNNLKNLSDWKYYANPIYEYLKNNYNLTVRETQNSTQPYILIIDEINRGNISKIFGELITLIEEDKRETMSVKLPYSQDNFTVPKNLYIIGTMNTSDRSIASIDIALRRRFKFIEMMPKSELVADFGCGFQTIFEKLNTKIKILLDRDHQIGHSYFINTKYANADVNTLKEIWFSEIIPLLNEYFYCDWEKLKLVIPGFIKEINIPEELKNECEDSMYEFKTPNEVKDFVGALKQDKFKQEN